MSRVSKIEEFNLSLRTSELVHSGVPPSEIRTILMEENEGFRISLSAVEKYVKKVKMSAEDAAQVMIREHVKQELPKDLDMIEDIQGESFRRSKEKVADIADRIAETAAEMESSVERWREMLNTEKPKTAVKRIIQEILRLIGAEDRRDDISMKYMQMVLKALEVKFRTGLGEVANTGNIQIFMNKGKEKNGQDGYEPFTLLKGGVDSE